MQRPFSAGFVSWNISVADRQTAILAFSHQRFLYQRNLSHINLYKCSVRVIEVWQCSQPVGWDLHKGSQSDSLSDGQSVRLESRNEDIFCYLFFSKYLKLNKPSDTSMLWLICRTSKPSNLVTTSKTALNASQVRLKENTTTWCHHRMHLFINWKQSLWGSKMHSLCSLDLEKADYNF